MCAGRWPSLRRQGILHAVKVGRRMWAWVLVGGVGYFLLGFLGALLGGDDAGWSVLFGVVFALICVSHLVRPRDLSVPRRWAVRALLVFAALSLAGGVRATVDAVHASGSDRAGYSAIAAGFLVCVAIFAFITVDARRQPETDPDGPWIEENGPSEAPHGD